MLRGGGGWDFEKKRGEKNELACELSIPRGGHDRVSALPPAYTAVQLACDPSSLVA